jgi:predicted Zn-dependent protease
MTITVESTLAALFFSTLLAGPLVAQAQPQRFIPVEKEIAMGRQMAAQLERQVRVIHDPAISEYVNRVGQNLVRNSDSYIPFAIQLVDSEEVNALSLPGGYVYINAGVILAAENEAELAAVIAHQIAHIIARHGAEITMPPVFFDFGGFTYRQSPGNQVRAEFLQTLQKDVAEADSLGVQYLYKTGYDPRAAVRFLEKLQALELAAPSVSRTHPPTAERIEATQKSIDAGMPPRDQNVVTTAEFESIKRRVFSKDWK